MKELELILQSVKGPATNVRNVEFDAQEAEHQPIQEATHLENFPESDEESTPKKQIQPKKVSKIPLVNIFRKVNVLL